MTEAFESTRYSIQHAQNRLEALRSEIVKFNESQPYEHVTEPNDDLTYRSHKIRLVRPIPPSLPGIIADTANALRSSLDHIGYTIAIATGKSGKLSHFPFGTDKQGASACSGGKSRDIPQEIFDTMISFKPYRGGNDTLWALNNLCNTMKHEIITRPAAVPDAMGAKWRQYPGITPAPWPPRWDEQKHEMEIARSPMEIGEERVHFFGQFFLAITNIDGIKREPILQTLHAMSNEVERCFSVLEDRARHFGFIV